MDGVADGRYDSDREALRRRFHPSCLAAWVTHVVQFRVRIVESGGYFGEILTQPIALARNCVRARQQTSL
jgi:hypothetical protein